MKNLYNNIVAFLINKFSMMKSYHSGGVQKIVSRYNMRIRVIQQKLYNPK